MITDAEKDQITKMLATGYYIILTHDKYSFNGFLVKILTWLKLGVWPIYTHVLMNCDNISDPSQYKDFKFVEATISEGVHYTTFDEVFSTDKVCLLTPAYLENETWTNVIDTLVQQVGKPYDMLFDIVDASKESCVEVVLQALKAANYQTEFANLDHMIKQEGNLVPEMFRTCPDFVVAYEQKHQ